MPQNNQSITGSPEFKEFCKNANLEVLNQESINCLLFAHNMCIDDLSDRVKKIEEMIMEIAKNIKEPDRKFINSDGDGIVYVGESLFDKWNNKGA